MSWTYACGFPAAASWVRAVWRRSCQGRKGLSIPARRRAGRRYSRASLLGSSGVPFSRVAEDELTVPLEGALAPVLLEEGERARAELDRLDMMLRLGVLLAEENQIINGDGASPNLRGILNTAGIGSVAKGAGEPSIEALHRAITTCRLAFLEPDAIVLHPNDWQEVRLSKDADGNYLTAPVTDEGPPKLLGKEVVTSPVIAEGTGVVGAFAAGATVWEREDARVSFTETGLGDTAGTELFSRNLVRFRAEERIAFGVERPAAFCAVTGI